MKFVVAGSDWDDGNRDKCEKHGVSSAEIEALFAGELMIFPDIAHSQSETRFPAIGRNREDRHIVVAFVLRQPSEGRLIRPISARCMHKREVEHYEKEIAKADKR